MSRRAVAAGLVLLAAVAPAHAQSCPAPLASALRLLVVTADGMNTPEATAQLFERRSVREPWRPASPKEAALIGKSGMAWPPFFRALARKGEPVKVEGDKRSPAGFYRIGKSFGLVASDLPGYTRIADGMTCVDDLASPAYNSVTTRAAVGWTVHGENMWRVPEYKRGLFVDYPTDRAARAGSCIFIHVRLPGKTGTGGCVALPEDRVAALQTFSEPGAVLAILPKQALGRLSGCLPVN